MKLDPKIEYDSWIDLLKRTKNEDLLSDPYNIWIEAWSVALMSLIKNSPTEVGDKDST